MRHDMPKVLVERPRHRSEDGYRPRRRVEKALRLVEEEVVVTEELCRECHPEGGYTHGTGRYVLDSDAPKRTKVRSTREKAKYRRKSMNENLAPLHRFLRSRCGRPWDAVYSEICERMRRDSPIQLHIWEHLTRDIVLLHAHEIDGKISRPDQVSSHRPGYYVRYWPFYVLEHDGVLRENRPRVRTRQGPNEAGFVRLRVLSKFGLPVQLRRVAGVWYRCEVRPAKIVTTPDGNRKLCDRCLVDGVIDRPIYDVGGRWIRNPDGTYRAPLTRVDVVVSKQQLSKRELRRHGLKND